MKGGDKIYPNEGVKIDPRAITSLKMPESLKVYSGYLNDGYDYLKGEGILTRKDVEREDQKIKNLSPLCQSENKFASSYWFHSDTHLIEFLHTSVYNYKVYALRIVFKEETNSFFRL
jgi:CTP:phosphocholine cytidylyltransferase-like protein